MNQGMLSEFVTERETHVTFSPGDPVVRVWTNVAHHVRAFRADDAYTETETWPADPDKGIHEAASFTIRRDLYDPVRGRRRPRAMTEEQRKAAGDRLRAARAKRLVPAVHSAPSENESFPPPGQFGYSQTVCDPIRDAEAAASAWLLAEAYRIESGPAPDLHSGTDTASENGETND